jgi:hypothetical protein
MKISLCMITSELTLLKKTDMRQIFRTSISLICLIFLCSWGRTGHETIAIIAQAHLTLRTAQTVHDLLGQESLADVSNYADEIRTDSFFSFSAPWHYIDVPAHENFDQFKISVYQESGQNLYRALVHWENVLKRKSTPRAVKIFALKMVVHLVGDMHQPLHVGRSEDRGGNDIHVLFEGDSTNLHAVWDSGLIGKTKMSASELAKSWDTASDQTIKDWQAEPLITSMYVSNHVGNHIYDQLPSDKVLTDAYYSANISMVRQRIMQAGIRLAGILNNAFDPSAESGAPEDTTVCYKVYGGKYLEGSQITLLNLGGPFPDQKFTVVIKGNDRNKFKNPPEIFFDQKKICVSGVIEMYKGKPEIIVSDPSQIVVKE